MLTLRKLIACTLISLSLSALAIAQTIEARPEHAIAAAPTITVSASATRVRFTALGLVRQMRLQIFDASGSQLFDSGFLAGGVRDWSPRDAKGPALPDGAYHCVVTARDLTGRLSLRQGTVVLSGGEFSLQLDEPAGEVERGQQDVALSAVEGDAPAVTLTAHDGREGSLTSTAGSLTLRTGDVFLGTEREHIRITEEGKVGIGTDNPEATLDVVGTIRARGLLLDKTGGDPKVDGDPQPLVDGIGTTNQVTKWTNGPAGTLGDSAITEVGGKVGIGTTSPTYRLVVGPDFGPGLVFADLTVSKGPGQSVSAYIGAHGSGGMEFGWNASTGNAYLNSPGQPIIFMQQGTIERMRIDTAGNIGIGATTPSSKLDVAGHINTSTQYNIGGNRVLGAPANSIFVGVNAGAANITGSSNTFVGSQAGGNNTAGSNNTFLGTGTGLGITTGSNNTLIGANANISSGSLSFATAIGAGAVADSQNTIVLGRNQRQDKTVVWGTLQLQTVSTGGITALCWNSLNLVSICSSSLRYKTDIAPFSSGLSLVQHLHPIRFAWKDGGMKDIGFGAEDVAAVEPLLVTYNAKGEVEGVKYDRISAVLVNAVKEQQAQIEVQQQQLKQQQKLIDGLKKILCQESPTADVCR